MRLFLSSYKFGNQPQKLLDLLGERTRVGFIANAVDYRPTEERSTRVHQELHALRTLGLDPHEIDLRKFFENQRGLEQQLNTIDLLWVRGGNAFILRRAFRQSRADELIDQLLTSDALVYGGYSAGIDMLTPTLRGIDLVDDPNLVPRSYDPAVIWEGLNILSYSIAPHYKSDHPESAAVDRSIEYLIHHHLPFIALRDGEVIVRNGNHESVLA